MIFLYSGNTVIQKTQRSRRKTAGGLGSLSRLPKSPAVKANVTENGKSYVCVTLRYST